MKSQSRTRKVKRGEERKKERKGGESARSTSTSRYPRRNRLPKAHRGRRRGGGDVRVPHPRLGPSSATSECLVPRPAIQASQVRSTPGRLVLLGTDRTCVSGGWQLIAVSLARSAGAGGACESVGKLDLDMAFAPPNHGCPSWPRHVRVDCVDA